jgi:LmbE family N-acetylglucosaminyl deacetylase
MKWIYLSPHFDDAVLSCGGLIWEQVHAGQTVQIWTICAGMPAEGEPFSDFALGLHARWQTGPEAVLVRKEEDEKAGKVLGAPIRYGDLPDCIYRRLPDGSFVVNGEEDLWREVHPLEAPAVDQLVTWMNVALTSEDQLVCPMTLGDHVDHRLVRKAAEALGRPLWMYADFPYVVQHPESLAAMLQPDWRKECFGVSRSALTAWQDAIAEYPSQISTFWNGLEGMREAMEAYWKMNGGACLWKTVNHP